MKRKSFDEILVGFDKEDYIVVSVSYTSAITPLKVVCDKGHIIEMRWNDFQQGKRCKDCYNDRMMTLEKAVIAFGKVGFTVTSTRYVNNTVAMRFVCDKGHVGSLAWQNFRRGIGCKECKEEAKLEKKYCSKCGKECNRLERGMCSRCYKEEYMSGNCIKCGKHGVLIKKMCQRCYSKFERPRGICIFCSREKIIHTRDDEGSPVCISCYTKHVKKKEVCSNCGELRLVQFRESGGSPVCNKCYQEKYAPKRVCSICGEKRTVSKNAVDGPVCGKCYAQKYKVIEKCDICNNIKHIYINNDTGSFCQSCYKKFLKKKEICAHCGKTKCIVLRTKGLNLCGLCADKRRKKEDPAYRCLVLLRSRVRKAFMEYSKIGKIRSADEYGIEYKKIIDHLGPKPEGNYHIDHILPLSAFDFDNLEQIRAAFAPENHQWLLAKENLEKRNKYNKEELEIYLKRFSKT